MKLFIDLETYSTLDLREVGAYRYAQECEILLIAWAVDSGPVKVLDLTETYTIAEANLTGELRAAWLRADEIIAHNSFFDRSVMTAHGWPERGKAWRDSMTLALSLCLPGSLDQLGSVCGLPEDQRKLASGRKLRNRFTTPTPANHNIRRYTRQTHPYEWADFIKYAAQDVEAMRTLWDMLPKWNYRGLELDLWHLDQVINDRGVAVDIQLARSVVSALELEQHRLVGEMRRVTGGVVQSGTELAKLRGWVRSQGVETDSLDKAHVTALLTKSIPGVVREALLLRQQQGRTSVAKFAKVMGAEYWGRVRGMFQFDGARTKRWAGRLVQLQNLPARTGVSADDIDLAIWFFKNNCADLAFDVNLAASACVRPIFVPEQGQKLLVADLANIEGRVLAWLAQEEWKLKAFRDYDKCIGSDIYKLAYARAFGVTPESVTDEQRQIGKVMELALGYNGGVKAFVEMAEGYGIDLDDMAYPVLSAAPEWAIEEARGWHAKSVTKNQDYGLEKDTFVACDVLKRLWRGTHPNTEALWRAVENGFRAALDQPGVGVRVGRFSFMYKVDHFLKPVLVKMPSGRYMVYPFAEVARRSGKDMLAFMGVDSVTKQWCQIFTYGGKLVENFTQHESRCVMADNLQAVEDLDIHVVMTSHDEIIGEADMSGPTHEALASVLSRVPPWACGLPLAAKGKAMTYYRK